MRHVSEWGLPFDILDLRITVKRLLDKERTKIPKFKENVPTPIFQLSLLVYYRPLMTLR